MINLISYQSGQTISGAQERANLSMLVTQVPQSQSSLPLRSEPKSISAVLVSVSAIEQIDTSTTFVAPTSETKEANLTSVRESPQNSAATSGYSEQEMAMLRELSARDREVRQHELAHKSAAGSLAGAVSYDYQRGPDGRMYAVGGEVSIKTSTTSSDPKEALRQAEQLMRAATAPANPSAQDLRVAASARMTADQARAEIALQRVEEQSQSTAQDSSNDSEIDSSSQTPVSGLEVRSQVDKVEEEKTDYFSEIKSARERTALELEAYQDRLSDIQQQIAEVNQRLAELGILDQLYEPGGLVYEET